MIVAGPGIVPTIPIVFDPWDHHVEHCRLAISHHKQHSRLAVRHHDGVRIWWYHHGRHNKQHGRLATRHQKAAQQVMAAREKAVAAMAAQREAAAAAAGSGGGASSAGQSVEAGAWTMQEAEAAASTDNPERNYEIAERNFLGNVRSCVKHSQGTFKAKFLQEGDWGAVKVNWHTETSTGKMACTTTVQDCEGQIVSRTINWADHTA